ncbi:hypothetical protein L6R49_07980 [Myxococcota bacterium]|nr:hypothetical protein [Myxococcota bacterium]
MPFFRNEPVTTLLVWALLAALIDVLVRLVRRRAPPEDALTQGGLIFVDLAAMVGLGVWGVQEASRLHELANPAWTPLGQDSPEFLSMLAVAATGVEVPGLGYRYPLYPMISAAYGAWRGLSPAEAGLAVSTMALGLLPAALYHLGVQLAPRGVALAMALLSLTSPLVLSFLGQPTDYPLCALLQLSACAWGLSWARRPEPHAALGLGLCLGILGLATPKALLALGVWLLGAVLVAPWRTPWRALLGLSLLLSPVVGAWTLMARLDPPRHSLEHAVFVVERAYASQHGVALTAADYGLPPGTPEFGEGHYRFGDPAALAHLPDTLRFFTTRPPTYPPLEDRLDAHKAGMVAELGVGQLPEALWLPLMVVGALGACRGGGRWRGLVGAACLLGVVGGGLLGALRVEHTPRYVLASLVMLPSLWAAGVVTFTSGLASLVARRLGAEWPSRPALGSLGLPLMAFAFAQEPPTEGLRAEAARRAAHPVSALVALRDQLQPDDVVVDGTLSRAATAMFLGRARIEQAVVPTAGPPVHYGDEPVGGRRFVVVGCAFTPCQQPAWRVALHQTDRSPRMRRLADGLWEDLRPQEPGVIPPPIPSAVTPAAPPATSPPDAPARPATPPASPPPGP